MICCSLHTNNTHGVKDAVLYLIHSLCFPDHRLGELYFWDIKEQQGGSTGECPGSIPFHITHYFHRTQICMY